MKNINTRKVVAGVAALGLSALLAGSVVAANVGGDDFSLDITKDTMYSAGVPNVSVIVGSMAQPIDVVWAGNIAAAIGKKAYTTTGATGGAAALESVTVEVGATGTTTVSGDGKLFDNESLNFADNSTITLRYSDADFLYNETVDVDGTTAFTGNSFSSNKMTVRDEVNINNANFGFNSDKDVADIVASFPEQSMLYTMTFSGNGIPVGYTDADSDERLKIHFMGKSYIVDEATATSLKLLLDKEDLSLAAGDTFIPEEGFVIEVMEILEASSSTFAVELELRDADGTVIKTAVFEDGDNVFKTELDAIVSVNTVYNTRVTLTTGASASITLTDGSDIEDFPNSGDELWYVELSQSGGAPTTHIDKVVINNNFDYEFIDEDALKAGDKISIFGGLADIDFLGTTVETMFDFEVSNNEIKYVDDLGNNLSLFMYEQRTSTDLTRYTTRGMIDGQKLYFEFDTTADTFTVQLNDSDGDYLSAVTSGTWQAASADLAYDDGFWTDFDLPSYDNSTITYNYGILVDETSSKVTEFALGLKEGLINTNALEGVAHSLDFVGYDITPASGAYAAVANAPYFGATTWDGAKWHSAVSAEYQAYGQFNLYDGTAAADNAIVFYVDVWTGKLVDTESTNFDDLSYMAALTPGNDLTTNKYTLGVRNSDDLSWGMTDEGVYFEIDSKAFKAEIPDKALKAKLFVGAGSSVEETLEGGELVLTTPGTVVSTEDGMVSAKLVSANVTGGADGDVITPGNWNVNTKRLVYLDNETITGAGPKVIVGGHLVNALAEGVTNEYLTEAGQFVVGAAANGNIVVAGWTAADTADAAKELISVIENM
jgi:hypothetical protein